MIKEKLIPELRFPGFKKKWQSNKLDKITNRVTRKNDNQNVSHVLTISGQDGLIDQREYFSKQIASKNLSNYYLIYKDEFAYNKSYSNGYPYGAVKRLTRYKEGVLSSLYICFKVQETKVDTNYFENYFETDKWHKEIYKIAVEGARNHGLLNVRISDFFNTIHRLPSKSEQEKIGSFFYKIDKKIELQENLIENLEEQKKGLMQRIFNQEVRFKDENGNEYPEWKEYKLKQIVSAKDTIDNIKDWYLEIGDIDVKYKSYKIDKEKEVIKTSSPSKKGTILISTVRPTRGAIVKLKDNLYSSSAFSQLYIENKHLRNFIFHRLSQESFFIDLGRLSTGSTYPTVNKDDILNYKVTVTMDSEELKYISELFSWYETKINLENIKLINYKEYKKGLMQRMFI